MNIPRCIEIKVPIILESTHRQTNVKNCDRGSEFNKNNKRPTALSKETKGEGASNDLIKMQETPDSTIV